MVLYNVSCKRDEIQSPRISEVHEVQFETTKIWDSASHNAFTDLIRYQEYFYATFREGTGHVPREDNTGDGMIRIIRSKDGTDWESVALIREEYWDLRDPKLSITPDGRLMVLMGGSDYFGLEMRRRVPHVSFSEDGKKFSGPIPLKFDKRVSSPWNWVWRVTWHQNMGYGVTYQVVPVGDSSLVYLLRTSDGINYEPVTQLKLDGLPNEATIRFDENDQMYIVIRRERKDQEGYIGYSKAPYKDWTWNSLGMRLGGPDFLFVPDGTIMMGTRIYTDEEYYTGLFKVDSDGNTREIYRFPSGGDTSYPGMVWENDTLYVSYYSSHEGKTAIYLARLTW